MSAFHSHTDNDLFTLVAKDDVMAFQILYDRYWQKLLVKAKSKLKNEQESEDIVQEVFINLWRKRRVIHLNFLFHTYISAMLRHEIIRRMSKKYQVVHLESIESIDIQGYSTNDNTNYDFLKDEIQKNIQSLPEKCRLVFRLSREEGMSQKQISDTLKINRKTVEAHIHKALKALRSSLQHFSIVLIFIGG